VINLALIYFIFLAVFASIGAIRGWAKELLVSFSVILALFILMIAENYVPVADAFLAKTGLLQFWFRSLLLLALVVFGYQTPYLQIFKKDGERFHRSKVQDTLLGLIFGLINGYLIVGTLWFYLDKLGYPSAWFTAPDSSQPMGDVIVGLLGWLPPQWLDGPVLFIVFAVFSVFILVLFV
jgi:hypothetical protein